MSNIEGTTIRPRFYVPNETGDTVYDDDFGYDATIKITGDFASQKRKYEYACAVADALNAVEIPTPATSKHSESETESQ